ncbi:MAG: endonuclease/exonuclease/phosphatase family protein [Mycobacterium sp.]
MRWGVIATAVTVIGVASLSAAIAGLAARYTPGVILAVVVAAALAPYLMLGAAVALICFVAVGNWPGAALAGVLTVAMVAVRAPWYIRRKTSVGVSVRFMSANLRYGRAEPDALVRLASAHADILVAQELTPEISQLLLAAGLSEMFPYQVLRHREGPAGVGIWSRFPMEPDADYEDYWLGLITARIDVPDVPTQTTVGVTHLSAPWPDPLRGWRDDLARLPTTLQKIAASSHGPVILGGDLNATPDNWEFRRLLRNGYHDAAAQAGAGLTRTHPADVPLPPPVFALDHILTRGCTATGVRTVGVPGSDHRALVADISIPGS